jgi:hypothetical protein
MDGAEGVQNRHRCATAAVRMWRRRPGVMPHMHIGGPCRLLRQTRSELHQLAKVDG